MDKREQIINTVCENRSKKDVKIIMAMSRRNFPENPYGLHYQILIQYGLLKSKVTLSLSERFNDK